MKIKHIKGTNFKNYTEVNIEPSEVCNVIYGANGSGKTNLLDLIHFLSFGKSYFTISDKQAIQNETDFFRIESILSDPKDNESRIAISIPTTGSKKIWHNGAVLEKNTDILGIVPLVTIVPDDIDLVKGTSSIRRKFIDRILCQLHKDYTRSLVIYQRTLKQKMSLLKNTKGIHQLDSLLLDSYDTLLNEHGQIISKKRKDFVNDFSPIFLELYNEIAELKESVSIKYQSNFNSETFSSDIKLNLEQDFYSKRVRLGIHRDELEFLIQGQSIRKFGSQGQIKTFIYALKLSEYLYLSHQSEKKPILLLDDIFEKLDRNRLLRLFNLVISDRFGQIFISDTELNRASDILNELNTDYLSFEVNNNEVTRTNNG